VSKHEHVKHTGIHSIMHIYTYTHAYIVTNMTIAGQLFGKHVLAAVRDELLEIVISRRFALSYKREYIRELIN
jgi:hypothetical protein